MVRVNLLRKVCECGCGGEIPPKLHHKYHPPRFLWGHGRKGTTRTFFQENHGKHICACGCGEPIELKMRHRSQGIPKFKPNHHLKLLKATTPKTRTRSGRRADFPFWDRVRLLRSADFRCEQCDAEPALEDLQFDHIQPVWAGGTNSIKNGQVLCVGCHNKKTRQDRIAYRKSLNIRLVEK